MSLKDLRIGFVGAGAMAEALVGGLEAAGIAAESLMASDLDAARRERLHQLFGIHTTKDNRALLELYEVINLYSGLNRLNIGLQTQTDEEPWHGCGGAR